MDGNYFGYLRISTKETSDKQSFARQIKGMENYVKSNDIEFTLYTFAYLRQYHKGILN